MLQHKMIKPYMETARAFSQLSHAKRKRVGAIAVTPQDVVIYSWNGRPSGDDNCCELTPELTHPEVLHAEANIVSKAAREGISLKDADIYVTLSPCLPCSLQLFQAGVKTVTYDEEYRLTDGIDFLKRKQVSVIKYEESV
jgi:dCMP deaminase